MKKDIKTIECPTRDFNLIAFEIDPIGEDADLVNAVHDEARRHGASAYAPSGRRRSQEALRKTRYLGVLSEKLLVNHLQDELESNAYVSNRIFEDYGNHVDIEIEKDGRITTLEVRSSFLYISLERIVCEAHGVIGPYSTSYKPGEKPKDFYLYALINQARRRFSFGEKHTLYFASGAPYEWFLEKGEERNLKQENANYLLIVPMVNAMDAIEVVDAIRRHGNGI